MPNKHGRRYPWRSWFKTKRFTAQAGIDFNGRADTFAQQVRNRVSLSRPDLSPHITISDDGQTVEVLLLSRRNLRSTDGGTTGKKYPHQRRTETCPE